jgi:rhodanese-related sulfurtransferase
MSNAAPNIATPDPTQVLLAKVREQATRDGIPFAGTVSPQDAWLFFTNDAAVIVDVRTAEERKFVGHVPGSLHVPWMIGTALTRNPRFTRELELKAKKHEVVLLLCRSGKRSAQAAEAATKAGFVNVFNIREGFEGDLDDGQRGASNGWRHHNLPWQQD